MKIEARDEEFHGILSYILLQVSVLAAHTGQHARNTVKKVYLCCADGFALATQSKDLAQTDTTVTVHYSPQYS